MITCNTLYLLLKYWKC